jgi:predicted homoserine dehydrogenase-like protein
MIIVDNALKRRAAERNPVRVAIVGAGNIGRVMTLQIEKYVTGMKLVAIANRTLKNAERAYRLAGIDSINKVETVAQLEKSITTGQYAITNDPSLLCEARGIEAIIEATGEVEFGAHVAFQAIENRKHIIIMNAELDATLGPILKVYADRAGVIISNADGDQPGVIMNLFRFVKSIGCDPVLAGNIKGLQDHYRTPETQKQFAEKNDLTPKMATSFADGTKISMENAVVANATTFKVGQRGMYGPQCNHVRETVSLFPLDQMLNGGLVDYILGAEPGPGVFVLGYNDNPTVQLTLKTLKMGDGPLYVFYVPYHLPHLEAHLTMARAVLFNDATIAPISGPVCDVITVAKRNLKTGEILDGIGGFTCYGEIENYEVSHAEKLLPMGLSEGCHLKRDIPKDMAISYNDLRLPEGRLSDKLRTEQDARFPSATMPR